MELPALPGWSLDVVEKPPGWFTASGRDGAGRSVTADDFSADSAIRQCGQAARFLIDLPTSQFDVREVSAGVYRASGRKPAGRRLECTGLDPEALLEECRDIARAMVQTNVG